MNTALMSKVTGPMASDIASEASSAATAAIHTVRTLIAPVATGLSVRPTAVSRGASMASLDQPTES